MYSVCHCVTTPQPVFFVFFCCLFFANKRQKILCTIFSPQHIVWPVWALKYKGIWELFKCASSRVFLTLILCAIKCSLCSWFPFLLIHPSSFFLYHATSHLLVRNSIRLICGPLGFSDACVCERKLCRGNKQCCSESIATSWCLFTSVSLLFGRKTGTELADIFVLIDLFLWGRHSAFRKISEQAYTQVSL